MPSVLRIRNWDKHYENNRTRELRTMLRVCISNDITNLGFLQIMNEPDGLEILGIWTFLLQVASRCTPRGTLWARNSYPHTAESLALLARKDIHRLSTGIQYLINLGWIENYDQSAEKRPDGAEKRPLYCSSTVLEKKEMQKKEMLPISQEPNDKINQIIKLLGKGNFAIDKRETPRWQSVLKHLTEWPLEEIATQIQAIRLRSGTEKPPLYYLEGARRRLLEIQHEDRKKEQVPAFVKQIQKQAG